VIGGWSTEVISDPNDLERERGAWDALAVSASRPYSAPGWLLPWWSSVRPVGCEFRAVAVRDGADLVGLAPFQLNRERFGITTWRLIGDTTSSYLQPLARRAALEPVAAAIATALSRADRNVDVVSLAAVPSTSPWPELLRERWPGRRPQLCLVEKMRAPYVDIPDGGFDEWLGARSRNFRQQVRRRRREVIRRGGQLRQANSPAEMATALEDFQRLHRKRWDQRGGSHALTPGVVAMLRQAGKLLPPTRLRILTAEVDGVAIGAALFLAAGSEMHYWLGGFDDDWSSCSPSILLLVEAVRYAADAGYRRVSLGPGAQPYKYRLATGEDQLAWIDLVPHARRYPYVRVCQAPYRLYRLASNRTPPRMKQGIRSSVGSLLGRRSARPLEPDEESTRETA
jgi:CelD/BcsL family acetyltransferase involved in cellulose biosynthesis